MTRDEGRSIRISRWALAVPVGVLGSVGAGLIVNAVLGAGQAPATWLTNIGAALIVLVGSLVTGTVAKARSLREWVQAAMLTFAGLVAIAVLVFVFVAVTEPPR